MCALYGAGHDMCLKEVGDKCGEKSWNNIGLTPEQQIEMIDVHNAYRRKVSEGQIDQGFVRDLRQIWTASSLCFRSEPSNSFRIKTFAKAKVGDRFSNRAFSCPTGTKLCNLIISKLLFESNIFFAYESSMVLARIAKITEVS